LICRQCGQAVDVDCAVANTPRLTAAEAAGYQIEVAEVIYWGTCPACRSSTREPRPRKGNAPSTAKKNQTRKRSSKNRRT
jgi:hypothetical protein